MRLFLVMAVILGGLLLAACGPGASSNQPTAQPVSAQPVDVQVKMSEFKVEPSITTFKVGVPYRFTVTNTGTVAHDFSISPPTMAHHGGSGMSVEEAHKDALAVIEADELPPGATKTVEVTFSKPTSQTSLEIACHTPGHYEAGMLLPITVN
jgi:uncharacterized cupredoxin-like copper-binding protein